MKYFSKLLSMLLVGAMLVSTACTDYAEDIKQTNGRVDVLEADVQEILDLLDKIECEHGVALDAIIAGHCDDLAGLAEDIQDANDKILALQGVDADLKKSIEFINSLLKELAGTEDESKLLSAMATWNALLDGLKVFYETQLEGLLSDVESAKAFMAAMNETLSAYKATYSQKAGMAAMVEDLETVIAHVTALEKEFAQYQEDVEVEFGKVYAAIASLGSVQSIVYVPEYSDGCATIDYALINNMIVEARSTMEFMVTPASGAGKIVSMFEANPESLAIVHEDLKERLNTRSAEHLFNIAKVYTKAGEADRLFVEFDARHLTPEFYAGDESLALSLVYNAGNEGNVTSEANVASCFVKTIATTKPEVLKIDLVDAGKKFVTNTLVETHVIQYTNEPRGEQVVPVTLADMHKVAFYAEGFEKEYRTFEQMVEQGYALTLENNINPMSKGGYVQDFSGVYGSVDQTKDPLSTSKKYTDGAHDYYQSEIAEYARKKEYIGYVGTFKYNYVVNTEYYKYDDVVDTTVNDLTPANFYVQSAVKIGKKAAIIPVTIDDIVWTYSKDAAIDALGEVDGWYSRTKIALPTLPSFKGEAPTALPADVEHHQILIGYEPVSVDFYYVDCKDGLKKTVAGSEAAIYHEAGNPCNHNQSACHYFLDINKFKWETWAHNVADGNVERAYTIEIVYSTETVDVVYQISVNTVDRCRKPVTVDYGTYNEIVYHSNLEFEYAGKNDVLSKLYDARVENQAKHYDIASAAYLKDIFVTNAHDVKANKVNGAAYEESKLVFDVKDFDFSVAYNYAEKVAVSKDVVADVLNYSKTFTTWYGQEYTVNKAIDFKTPDYLYAGIEPYFVYGENGKKYTDARPFYAPRMPEEWTVATWALTDFHIERVNMYAAFDLKKSHFAEDSFLFLEWENCVNAMPTYKSIDAIVNTPADAESNKEKDVNYRDTNGDIYEDTNMYQDLAGNWHYEYNDTIRPEFYLTGVKDTKHIAIYGDYAISYYGYDEEVATDSNLYVVNNDGTKYRVESNFDNNFANVYAATCEDYSNYFVKQYNPLNKLETIKSTVVTKVSASDEPYAVFLGQAFSLTDKRGAELINQTGVKDANGDIKFLITGNGTNGFAEGVDAAWAFGYPTDIDAACGCINGNTREELELTFSFNGKIPVQLEKFFTFDYENGVIYFDYSGENELKEPISIPVKVTLKSSWNCNKPWTAEATFVFEHASILK